MFLHLIQENNYIISQNHGVKTKSQNQNSAGFYKLSGSNKMLIYTIN